MLITEEPIVRPVVINKDVVNNAAIVCHWLNDEINNMPFLWEHKGLPKTTLKSKSGKTWLFVRERITGQKRNLISAVYQRENFEVEIIVDSHCVHYIFGSNLYAVTNFLNDFAADFPYKPRREESEEITQSLI